MTYQALARKWRPRAFDELVGQEHIVAALSHALDSDRVHHGFLFTGTRGIGKTTLARILAKCLNCEQGVSSTPCNECYPCRSIDDAQFVDLIEVDAASRTQVADMRELLDNVQYAPTMGRFKVYLIDEVHMLSTHSFNALLKTLEEPPPHVKFLFATTDPQKLPVTILSRCLQFNLRRLQREQIQAQLSRILEAETVAAEEEALRLVAQAADGSMRDGLSLVDQAIAQGGGQVGTDSVREMLGLIESEYVRDLLQALAGGEATAVFAVVDAVAQRSSAFAQLLNDLLNELFNLSLHKCDPALLAARQEAATWHAGIAELFDEEDLQLYYQIALIGKRDLPLAPDPRTGFEMILLRMLAFRPGNTLQGSAGNPDRARTAVGAGPATVAGSVSGTGASGSVAGQEGTDSAADSPTEDGQGLDWRRLARQLSLSGWSQELAMNLALQSRRDGVWSFELDPRYQHLVNDDRTGAVAAAISEQNGESVRVKIHLSQPNGETPVQSLAREKSERQMQVEEAFNSDPNVRRLIEQFDATVVEGSIRSRQ